MVRALARPGMQNTAKRWLVATRIYKVRNPKHVDAGEELEREIADTIAVLRISLKITSAVYDIFGARSGQKKRNIKH